MKRLVAAASAVLLSLPVMAHAQAMKNDDPTNKVAAGGILVEGWMGRTDAQSESIKDDKFETMGSGMHMTTGPHAIFWNPANTASGNYTVKATLTKVKATPHAESYGLFIAGSNLDNGDQEYLYCVVFGSGFYSVIHRLGGETQKIVNRAVNAAVSKAGENGTAKDEIAMSVTSDNVSCSINGTEVWSAPKSTVLGQGKMSTTDGVYGLRASHNLSIHVAGFGMTKN